MFSPVCSQLSRGARHAVAFGQLASWAFLANVTYAGCQWVMLVVLAKLGTAEMMGQFALGFAIAAPAFLLTNLSLREVLATDANAEYPFGDYLALRVAATGVGLLLIAGIAGLGAYRRETRAAILLVGVIKAIDALSDVLYGLMQKHERMDLIAGSVGMRGVFSVVALAAGVYLLGSVLWGLALIAVVWALVFLGHDLPAGARLLDTRIVPRWVRKDLVRLMRLSLPLGFTAMLISLSFMIPRYFLERFRGEYELGAFVALTSLTVVGGTVIGAVGQSASPRLARHSAAGDSAAVRRILVGVISLAALLGGAGVAVAMAWGRQILTALYRPEYAEHVDAFVVIMAAAGIGYVAALLGYAMTSARLFRIQTPLFAGVAAIAFVACAGRIPEHGLMGAAQANVMTVVANLVGVAAVNAYALTRLNPSLRVDRELYRETPGAGSSRV